MRGPTPKRGAPYSIVYRATDPQTGHTKQVSRWDWEEKEAVEDALAEITTQLGAGTYLRPNEQTSNDTPYLPTGPPKGQCGAIRICPLHSCLFLKRGAPRRSRQAVSVSPETTPSWLRIGLALADEPTLGVFLRPFSASRPYGELFSQ
jgi:hypothetical protein